MIGLKYDLHMHSCLSPCGDDDMTPYNLVNMAKLAGFDVIALTDHNSSLNCRAAMKHAEEAGILLIPGMELTTSEEVHVVCLFETLERAEAFSKLVWDRLPPIPSNEVFGHQVVMDDREQPTPHDEKLLINATDIGVYDVCKLMKQYDGFAFPAHIDRSSFSLIANLGFIDESMGFSLYEISPANDPEEYRKTIGLRSGQVLTNSDAHDLGAIPDAQRTLYAGEKSIKGVLAALRAR